MTRRANAGGRAGEQGGPPGTGYGDGTPTEGSRMQPDASFVVLVIAAYVMVTRALRLIAVLRRLALAVLVVMLAWMLGGCA